ncbi:MAG: hypothetical protein RLZZ354_587 [Pseudomonadota bacterium]|jgi:hypothetical protein
MFRITKNPHTSFGMGHPNLNPMGKITTQVQVGERPVYASRDEAKKAIQKGLERAKK